MNTEKNLESLRLILKGFNQEIGICNIDKLSNDDLKAIKKLYHGDSTDICVGNYVYEFMQVDQEIDINKLTVQEYKNLYHIEF